MESFEPASSFTPDTSFELLPFRFRVRVDGTVLLVNEVGDYLRCSRPQLEELVQKRLQPGSAFYHDLLGRMFIRLTGDDLPIELLSTRLRSRHAGLPDFTALHIFVVTLRCDHSCGYCQVSRVSPDKSQFDMPFPVGLRAVDLMFESPSPELKMEFQGGEPLLNFDLVRDLILYARGRNRIERRKLEFVVASNLSPLTDDMLAFLKEHRVCLSTSLDGPASLHNANRPNGTNSSHRVFESSLARARAALGADQVAALMTTSLLSLEQPERIIDEYVRLGFREIFLRPISPFGFAARGAAARKVHVQEYLRFYRRAMDHIIALNLAGTPMVELGSQILLQRILTSNASGFVNLQLLGGALSCAVYNYDGGVYPSDEARMLKEMGDDGLRLGEAFDSISDLYQSAALKILMKGGAHQALPGCSDCAYQPFCGPDPILHRTIQGDPVGVRPTSSFCQRMLAVFDHLFEILEGNDPFPIELLHAWARGSQGAAVVEA